MTVRQPATEPMLAVGQAEPRIGQQMGRASGRVNDLRASSAAWVRSNRVLATAMATGLVARLIFWIATDRRLDDALITIKFDKNLAAGFGLVHNLGAGHVQGFTSALSVLVPLPGELIAPGGGFAVIRLVSLACFLAGMIYARRICGALRLGMWPTGFVLSYLALDPLQVYFGVVGMETQIAVAVLLAGIFYVLTEDYTKSGVALGLAILARPDFALWVAPALLYLAVRNRRGGVRAALLTAAIIAPWVIFTTIYYGSPIPNTIVAKSAAFAPALPSLLHPGAWLHFLHVKLSQHGNEWMSVSPFYEKALVLRAPIANWVLETIVLIVVALGIVGAIRTWSIKSFRPALAYVLLFEAYKIVFLSFGYYDWYGPPAFAVLMIFAAVGLDTVSGLAVRALPENKRRISVGAIAAVPAVCLAVAYAAPLPFLTVSEARIQHRVESAVRVPLGRYLGKVVTPGQAFTSESSGYVGWYTNGTLYDFPGLESPRVAHLERDKRLSWASNQSPVGLASPQTIAYYLRPDWVVLRPNEWADFKARFAGVSKDYRVARIFGNPNARPELDVGGMIYWSTDQAFVVLRRVG
jgi:hypothetical protein